LRSKQREASPEFRPIADERPAIRQNHAFPARFSIRRLTGKIHRAGNDRQRNGKESLQSYSSAEHSSANLSLAFLPALSIVVLVAAGR
jgi:hypothetical protein